VESFYRGKHITVYIGSAAGGGTDAYGRLVARFLGEHVPGNPTVVPANMPGANGMVVVNQLYNALPRDGTAIGTFDRNVLLQALWDNPGAKFQPEKLNWLGSANIDASTCVTWHKTGVTNLEQFMTGDLVIGSTAVYNVNILDNLFGAHLKLINGYPGGNDVSLALERGEIDGRCNWSWSSVMGTRADWVRDKKIKIVVQFATKKHPDLPDVPLASELARTEEQRQIMNIFLSTQEMARPFAAPPEMPQDRVTALQDAFEAVMHDPRYVDDIA
jgi:tripartite-type tricarboxylate transporter receptor subunit TctC